MTLRSRAVALTLSVALIATALSLSTSADAPAAAATTGAGYSGITPYGGYLGNYIAPDGTRVYCMDSSRDWPSGATDGGNVVSSLATTWGDGLSATTIRKLNYALLKWGQTADPTNAAAVSAYVYAYTSSYARTNGAGYYAGAHYINGNGAVMAAYNVIWNEAEVDYAGPRDPGASVTIEMANAYDGSVTIDARPSQAAGRLTLHGAVVAGTGATSIAVRDGSVVPIRGVPGADASSYSIEASASFSLAMGAQQNLVVYSTGSQQRTIRGAFTGSVSFGAQDKTDEIALTFEPVVQTQVAARFVGQGGGFVDGVTANTSTGSWPNLESGEPAPVVATGTLYGPFTEQPDVAATAPADAPVVGHEKLTLTGPGDYRSAGTLTAPTAGFYTWVWSIAATEQSDEVSALMPDDYSFADQFGLVAESHVVPMAVSAVSQVSATEIGFGAEVSDGLSVSLDEGAWLSAEGEPLEAVFEGTAYFVAGDAAPATSATIPAEATPIGSATIVAAAPGIYPASQPVTAPTATAGYITWVWRLSPTSEFSQYFEPWADQFGLPAETTRVAPPTVATQAVAASAIGDEVHDTALVGGVLPTEPAYLVFEAYLQVSGAEPLCDASTRVFDSSATPVAVTQVGSYDSPVTRFTEYGTYFWVESLFSHDGELIHRGQCGADDETTLVAPGEVVTQAVSTILPGELAHDTAIVSGLVPRGSSLVFAAYSQVGVTDGPLCDSTTLVFTSEPLPIAKAGRYDSPETRLTATGRYYWVETLLDRNGEPLHIGKCGADTETTTVSVSSLANTGVPVLRSALVAAALLLLGITAIGAAMLRRRRLGR